MNNGPSRDFKTNMGDKFRKSRERLDEIRAETQAKARRAVRVTNNYAHDHPWRTVATVATLAFAAGFLMNTKRPRRIVLKQPKPVVKVKMPAPPPAKKNFSFGTFQALMPLVLMGLKMYSASRPKNKIVAHPIGSTNGTAPIP